MAPAGAPLGVDAPEPPLSELIGELLTTSDNNTAELLLKEIGATAGGAGTRPAGLAVVQAKLAEWGIPLDGVNLVDGSGLDRGDRLTCSALLAVLRHVGATGPIADGLPVAGQTGTLSDQFAGNPAVGRLRAKTGTLRDAKALTGFVDSPDGSRHISFGYVQNGPNADDRGDADLGRPRPCAHRVPDRAARRPARAAAPPAPSRPSSSPALPYPGRRWPPSRCSRWGPCCSPERSCRSTSSSRATGSSSRTAWPASPSSASC